MRTATDATGMTLTYDYNDLNKVTRITYPDGKQESFTYDDIGLPVQRTNARGIITE